MRGERCFCSRHRPSTLAEIAPRLARAQAARRLERRAEEVVFYLDKRERLTESGFDHQRSYAAWWELERLREELLEPESLRALERAA